MEVWRVYQEKSKAMAKEGSLGENSAPEVPDKDTQKIRFFA